MIHLLNGATEIRERSSEAVTVLPCKCAHTNGECQTWVQMCDEDYTEDHALHESARLNHLAGELT